MFYPSANRAMPPRKINVKNPTMPEFRNGGKIVFLTGFSRYLVLPSLLIKEMSFYPYFFYICDPCMENALKKHLCSNSYVLYED